jgi:hypothetical protein
MSATQPEPKTPPLPAGELTLPPPSAGQLSTPPAVHAFVVAEPIPAAPEVKDAALDSMVQSSERRRRMVMGVLAGVILLGLGTLFGLLASCS